MVTFLAQWRGPVESRPVASTTTPIIAHFFKNQGVADGRYAFLSDGPSGTLGFGSHDVTVSMAATRQSSSSALAGPVPHGVRPILTVIYDGSSADPNLNGTNPDGVTNFLIGSRANWTVGMPTFDGVRYGSLYPGVALLYTGGSDRLEGTFEVAASASAAVIHWHYAGAQALEIDKNTGDLVVTLAGISSPTRTVRERSPAAWQDYGGTRHSVQSEFVVGADSEISLAVGAINRQYPLVIDPTLVYSSYFGGSSQDSPKGVALDASGVYIAGITQSPDFPILNAEQPTYPRGSTGANFVSKFDLSGKHLIYSTFIGGTTYEQCFGIAVDGAGHAVITGDTHSPDYPVQNAYQPLYAGSGDAFVTSLAADGKSLVFSTFLGGSVDDLAVAVAVDSQSAIYVTGYTGGGGFPTTNNNFPSSGADTFVTKFNPAGALIYSVVIGTNSNSLEPAAIAVDGGGEAYVTGRTSSTDLPVTANAFQKSNAGSLDAFVFALTPGGDAFAYATYLGGGRPGVYDIGQDGGTAIAVAPSGEFTVTGTTTSDNFPLVNPIQSHRASTNSSTDMFVTKFAADGAHLVFSTYFGGTGDDTPYSLALDAVGQAYVGGITGSSDFPVQDAIPNTPQYGPGFLVRLTSVGQLSYSTYLGAYSVSVAVDGDGNAYVTGATQGGLPVTSDAQQPTFAGGTSDGFLMIVGPPAVTGVSPPEGATTGGTIVTITGSSFAGATSVQFGSTAASNVVVINPGTIQATSPAGGAGTVDVTVTTPSGTTPATSADHFTYVVASAGSYQAGQPTRICDTRPIQPGVVANQCNNGTSRAAAPIGPGGTLTIDVCAGAGASCSLSAVAINVAVTGATDSSFLTVYPTGVAQPNASNLNYTPGDTVANLVEVKVGSNGTITLYNHAGSVDVVVDLEGTVAGGSTSSGSPGLYTPVPPQRICDTRVDQVGVATNQCNNGGAGATLGSNGTLNVQITGQGGIPSTGVSAVVLNVAVTDTSNSGYLTAWPTDNPRPSASNVNWAAGQTVPNRVIVPVGHNGQISIYNFSGAADVVIDVNGWYGDGTEPPPPGATFTGITPTRICDTRADQPGVATNQCNSGGAGLPLGSGQTMTVQVTSTGGSVPAGARGVVVNVAVTGTTAASFLTVWPSDVSQPTISDLNWASGETVPNLVVVKLSSSGQINVFNHAGSTDVIVDVVGYYT